MAQKPVAMVKDHPSLQGVEDRAKRSEQASAETFARMQGSRPTPTQIEVDLAKVGALDLDAPKEDDGSGPEMVHVRALVPADEAGGYNTRAMSSTPKAQPTPPRQNPPPTPPKP